MKCWKCKAEERVEAYLDGLTRWWPQLNALQHVCTACGYSEELQLQPGKICLGYIYGAGTAHFAAMEEISVPDLQIYDRNTALEIRLNGGYWSIPAKT